MIFCIYRRDKGYFVCTGGAVVSGRGRDKGERMARLAVAVLIDANESQSNQSPGLTQALAKEPSLAPPKSSSQPACLLPTRGIPVSLAARDLRIRHPGRGARTRTVKSASTLAREALHLGRRTQVTQKEGLDTGSARFGIQRRRDGMQITGGRFLLLFLSIRHHMTEQGH